MAVAQLEPLQGELEKIRKEFEDNLELAKLEMRDRMKAEWTAQSLKWKQPETSAERVEPEAFVNERSYAAIGKRIRIELEEETKAIMEKKESIVKELFELEAKAVSNQEIPEKAESIKREISEILDYKNTLDGDLAKIEELKLMHSLEVVF